MKKKFQNSHERGFTLIELLVSSGIFITISGIVVSILFVTFRINQKADVLLAVKQNGNTALTQLTHNIRYAQILDDPISCVTPVTQESVTITSTQSFFSMNN